MIIIILVLLITVIVLYFRLFYIEKQIGSITSQLTANSNKKLTLELVNKKIERMAEEINKSIEDKLNCERDRVKLETHLRGTIANMSHDLRTPLTAIKGYIQFLKLEGLTEKEKNEYLKAAEQRVNSLEILLNDFYELSLIESLDFKINVTKVNISRVLQEILMEKYPDFEKRELIPNIKIQSENIYVIADKNGLERIIENLLSNAIKYTKDSMDIQLYLQDEIVILQISNNTDNLKSEEVDKIFDRFYMADKVRSVSGTGLGLSIVKELVERMEGSIRADMFENTLNIYCNFKTCLKN